MSLLHRNGPPRCENTLATLTPRSAVAAEGQYIYYSRTRAPDLTDPSNAHYDLERVHLQRSTIDPVINSAIWRSLSPDGRSMAYLTVEPEFSDNFLYTADPSGSDQGLAVDPGAFKAVNAQIFSRDSNTNYLSGVVEQTARSGNRSLREVITGNIDEPIKTNNFWRISF